MEFLKTSVAPRGYYGEHFLSITIAFDSIEFNRIKMKQDPLEFYMPRIKNMVYQLYKISGIPIYQRASYHSKYPRAKDGKVILSLLFEYK